MQIDPKFNENPVFGENYWDLSLILGIPPVIRSLYDTFIYKHVIVDQIKKKVI